MPRHCLRCGHRWEKRPHCLGDLPAACPKCKTREWWRKARVIRSVLVRTKPVRVRRDKKRFPCPWCGVMLRHGTLMDHREACAAATTPPA